MRAGIVADMEPRKFFKALMEARGYNPNSLSRATGARTKQPQIVRFITGEAIEPKRSTLEPAAKVLGVPVEAFFDRAAAEAEIARLAIEDPARWANEQHSLGGRTTDLAQLMSHPEKKIDPPQMKWESILSVPLPQRFVLVIRDDSMAVPGQRGMSPGDRATFHRSETARPGDDVLLADAEGNLYIRTYQERKPGHWLAVARNPAFQPLDSKVDGLRVIGVLKGVEWE